jgi:hypothetical protein
LCSASIGMGDKFSFAMVALLLGVCGRE